MNIILFIVTIVISFTVVRIGAVAFQMTGLEWSLAKFQALSCFSGTGFTTKEAELITGHPRRRRIATILMVLGNAGLVTLIATLANSIRAETYLPRFKIPVLHVMLPSWLMPYINLAIMVLAIYLTYRLFSHSRLGNRITSLLRKRMLRREEVSPVSFDELLIATGGYGVSQIEIPAASPVAGKTLRDADLRALGINVLAIEHKGTTTPNPDPDATVSEGDRLVCFGKLRDIRRHVAGMHTSPEHVTES